MAFVGSSSPERRRFLRHQKPVFTGPNTIISSSSPRPAETAHGSKKKSFAPAAFRGLGCASLTASQARAPSSAASAASAGRSSADWQGKVHSQRVKHMKNERPPTATTDLWCVPIIALPSGNESVDCVVSHRDLLGRGWRRYPERTLRDSAGNHVQTSSMADSFPSLQAMLLESDLLPSRRSHHMRGYYHRPSVEVDEAMLFDNRILFGRRSFDQYRDWRLDVDNMTYEELLELGDKIGHVSAGLREEEIASSIREVNNTYLDMHFSNETERKCSICQEEFVMNDEVGKLGCGHIYHPHCIKKWLLQKNACPVCKVTVSEA